MNDVEDIEARIAKLRDALMATHRIKGRNLAHALKRAGRLLPRRLRKAGRELVAAEKLLGHPKLERMVDFAALRVASDRLIEHLEGVDVVAIRQRRMLGMFGLLAFYILFVAGAFILWMIWAGQL